MICDIKKILNITGCKLQFLILLFLRSPFDTAFTIVQAVFLQNAFDAVTQSDDNRLTYVCLTFGVLSFCLFLYNGTVWSIYAPFVVRMESKLRIKLFRKISMFSYERTEKTTHGEWLTRLNTDVQMPFSQPLHLPHMFNAALRIGMSAVILWYMNKSAFGLAMIFVIPHIIISQFFIARAMPKLNKKSLEDAAINTNELTVLITCAEIAELYDGKDYLMKRFENSSLCLLKSKMKIRNLNALNSAILPAFRLSCYLALLIAGSVWIADGSFTFGRLTAVSQYSIGVSWGSMMLINSLISIQASMAGIKRINEIMSEKTEGCNGG